MHITDEEIRSLRLKVCYILKEYPDYNPTHLARDADGEWYSYASEPTLYTSLKNRSINGYVGSDAKLLYNGGVRDQCCCVPLPPNLRQEEKE